MKRLAVIIKPENLDIMISSLREMGFDATIYDVKGAGKDKQRIASERGSGTIDLTYTTRKVVAAVVKSDDVDEAVDKTWINLAEEKTKDRFQPLYGVNWLPQKIVIGFYNG